MYTNAENGAKACEDTMGEYGGYINTPQTAADMDSILDAIGQEKMYYWGFSCKLLDSVVDSTNKYRWHNFGADVCPNVSRPRVQIDH